MHHCPSCESSLEVNRMDCPTCRLQLHGTFKLPRLARLPAEQFILAGGKLKGLAQLRGITYPTLRKHFDRLIEAAQVCAIRTTSAQSSCWQLPPQQGASRCKLKNGSRGWSFSSPVESPLPLQGRARARTRTNGVGH
jgi:hypothetical protein